MIVSEHQGPRSVEGHFHVFHMCGDARGQLLVLDASNRCLPILIFELDTNLNFRGRLDALKLRNLPLSADYWPSAHHFARQMTTTIYMSSRKQ